MTIRGTEHPLCLSTRVVCDVGEKYGDLAGLYEAMNAESLGAKLDAVLWMLAQLLRAGARYAALCGEEAPRPYTQDELADLLGVDELGGLMTAILETVTADTKREVEAEPPKNAEATGDNG